jgi:phasin family protein
MTYTAEQLIVAHQTRLKKLETLTNLGYAGFAKLAELNVAAARAIFADSFSHAQNLMGARHPQQLVALQLGLIQPLAEKSVAYGQQVSNLATETRANFSRAMEA